VRKPGSWFWPAVSCIGLRRVLVFVDQAVNDLRALNDAKDAYDKASGRMRGARLPGAGRLPGCMHAAQLRWPQAGPVRVTCGLAPVPARRAKTSPTGSWLAGSGSGRCAWIW
jgi:hypothetical protein